MVQSVEARAKAVKYDRKKLRLQSVVQLPPPNWWKGPDKSACI